MASTRATYNGIAFHQVLTEEISSEARFDRFSGAHVIHNAYTVSFRGIVQLGQGPGSGGVGIYAGTSSLADAIDVVMRRLCKPRRSFDMTIDGSTLFSVRPTQTERGPVSAPFYQLDLDNGPKTSARMLKIINTHSAWFSFQIEFAIAVCDDLKPSGAADGLINASWAVADDIDCGTWLTTRTFRGSLRSKSRNVSPHAYRAVVWPPLGEGFKRNRIAWNEAPDGLSLDFEIQDIECVEAPPAECSDWSAVHSVSSPYEYGTFAHDSYELTVVGKKTTHPSRLAQIATSVLFTKLNVDAILNDTSIAYPISMDVRHITGTQDNSVQASLTLKRVGGGDDKYSVFNLPAKRFATRLSDTGIIGNIPNVDPQYRGQRSYPHKPTAGTETIAAVFLQRAQDPCTPFRMRTTTSGPQYQTPNPQFFTGAGQTTIERDTTLQPYQNKYRQGHQYMNYFLTSEILYDTGAVALPCGRSKTDTDKTSNVIVNLYKPRCFRRLLIEAERLNKHPEIPDPTKSFKDEKTGITHTPVGEPKLIPSTPQLGADGVHTLYRTDCEILYALDRAPTEKDELPIGALPYHTGPDKYYTTHFKWPTATWIAEGKKPEGKTA